MQPISYVRATTVADAVRAIAAGGAGTRFLAGGTTMFDLMKLNVEMPTRLVDVTTLNELNGFDTSGSNELVFGAMARMSDVSADLRLAREYPVLAESLWKAASQQLRNMASVGGNLLQRTRCAYFRHGEPFACNKRHPGSGCSAQEGLDRGHALFGGSESCIAVYPGDWAIALIALDAKVDVLGPQGERTIDIERFHVEPGTTPHIETVLGHDELILRIRVPVTKVGRASTYHKIRDRESYAFALTSAAVALEFESRSDSGNGNSGGTRDGKADGDGAIVRDARVALGGVATRPWRARAAEQSLIGRPLTLDAARKAGEIAFAGARAGRDNGFRIELGIRTVADALMIAKGRA